MTGKVQPGLREKLYINVSVRLQILVLPEAFITSHVVADSQSVATEKSTSDDTGLTGILLNGISE
jgi:hypothetical protein